MVRSGQYVYFTKRTPQNLTHLRLAEHDMTFTSGDRADFILGGLLETLLFLASTLGYVPCSYLCIPWD